jgi:hypothetical protein
MFLLLPAIAVFYGSTHRSFLQRRLVPPSPPRHGFWAVPPLVFRCVAPSHPSHCCGQILHVIGRVLFPQHLFLIACLLFACLTWGLLFSSVGSLIF